MLDVNGNEAIHNNFFFFAKRSVFPNTVRSFYMLVIKNKKPAPFCRKLPWVQIMQFLLISPRYVKSLTDAVKFQNEVRVV